jgi:hypothetical protein
VAWHLRDQTSRANYSQTNLSDLAPKLTLQAVTKLTFRRVNLANLCNLNSLTLKHYHSSNRRSHPLRHSLKIRTHNPKVTMWLRILCRLSATLRTNCQIGNTWEEAVIVLLLIKIELIKIALIYKCKSSNNKIHLFSSRINILVNHLGRKSSINQLKAKYLTTILRLGHNRQSQIRIIRDPKVIMSIQFSIRTSLSSKITLN